MVKECETLDTCGFLKKHQSVNALACKGFILMYCRGAKINECKIKQYCLKNGVPPHPDMMPTGLKVGKDSKR